MYPLNIQTTKLNHPPKPPNQTTNWQSFSPTAESFGVSAQIVSGVVRGGPEVRFHEGSTRVPPGFHQGSTRVPIGFREVLRGLRGCGVVRALKRAPHAVGDII